MNAHERRPSSKAISRRDALKVLWHWTQAGAAAYGLARLGIDFAVGVPEASDAFVAKGYEPGWLETRNPDRPAFIDPHDFGEKKYLRYLAMHDSLLRKTHASVFTQAMNNDRKTVSLREAYERHLLGAYEQMRQTTAKLEDVVQVSLFSYASLYSSFYSVGDVATAFGVYDQARQPLPDETFDVAYYRGNVPNIFDHESHNDPIKIQHFAGFAFLTYTYAHARALNLPEATTVPRLAKAVAVLGSNAGDEGTIFATAGECRWEQWETERWINRMIKNRQYEPPDEGFFEPGFNSDMLASLMGIEFGRRLYDDARQGADIRTILGVLDTPMDLVSEDALTLFPVVSPAISPTQ